MDENIIHTTVEVVIKKVIFVAAVPVWNCLHFFLFRWLEAKGTNAGSDKRKNSYVKQKQRRFKRKKPLPVFKGRETKQIKYPNKIDHEREDGQKSLQNPYL